jgi:hypothetical protein
MDKINQYYKISQVKPEYHVLFAPYYIPSKKRIILNGKELELHYYTEFQTYIEGDPASFIGGCEKKITHMLI